MCSMCRLAVASGLQMADEENARTKQLFLRMIMCFDVLNVKRLSKTE